RLCRGNAGVAIHGVALRDAAQFPLGDRPMTVEMPQVPRGSGQHPITLVVISANKLGASAAFYAKLFGWQIQPMSPELSAAVLTGIPAVALRANVPAGSAAMVPYIAVPNLDAALARVVAAGGTVERAPWSVPMMGKLARFKDPSGTIYGLTTVTLPRQVPHIP